jgi:hypothetical protein
VANERRQRSNYVVGTLDVALGGTAGDTTLTGSALARLPVVDALSYAPLTIVDPVAGTHEVVYVTAHTAGAGTATVVRAMEGSTLRAWPLSSTFVVAPTAADFRPSLDDVWAGDLGYDEDFGRIAASSLPSPWVWASQNGSSYFEDRGWGNIITPGYASATGFYHFMIARLLPTPGTWTATVKLAGLFPKSTAAGTAANATFGIRNGTSLGFVTIEYRPQNSVLMVNYFTNQTTYSGSSALNVQWVPIGATVYLQISKTGANTYSFAISVNGSNFTTVVSNFTPAFTPDQLVIGAAQEIGPVGVGVTSIDWFRVR